MAGFGLLPVLLAVIFRLSDPEADQQEFTAQVLLNGFVITSVLPLVALVFGTASLGAEIEDGTAVYLLAKPVPRGEIIGAKLLGAWVATAVVVVTSTVVAGVIGLWGVQEDGILLGFLAAGLLGSLVYAAVFLALSIVTSRALIAGLVYVFLWEGLVTSLFSGTRIFSVRHYTLGLADWLARVPNNVFEAELNGWAALLAMAVVCAGAILIAVRRLEAFEIGEQS
jgi:ABC-2 type transport system permease protein